MTAILRDEQLVTAEHKQDFDVLFLEHYDRVYGILYRLLGNRAEAEDVAQEVFLRLYQKPPDLDGNVAGWLYRVATNAGYNAIRSRKRRWSWQRWLVQREHAPSPSELLESEEKRAAVRETLAQLKPQQAQLLLLRHMGMSYTEIAQALEINPASVGKLLSRASVAFQTAYQLMLKEQKNA